MKVMMAMSGGVDSSVAAWLLKCQGHEVLGAVLQMLPGEDEAVRKARRAAEELGMPLVVLPAEGPFAAHVIGPFIDSYEKGETPNPCVWCNRYMKFGLFWEYAREYGCDAMATGHYVRCVEHPETGRKTIAKAEDSKKDQSYMLWSLSQEQLSHVLFPLSERKKTEIKALAEQAGLSCAADGESQDICFVPDGDYAAYIRYHSDSGSEPGAFYTTDGQRVGTHRGMIHYTIGQRKGLGISWKEPLYVAEKRVRDNAVILCRDEELKKTELVCREVNWMGREKPETPVRAQVKIRYHHEPQPARLEPDEENGCRVIFDEPQRAITPGQSAVFYEEGRILGGGIIC